MGKIRSVFICFLFLLTLLFPVVSLLSACFGYRCRLVNITAFAIGIAAFSFITLLLDIVLKDKNEIKLVSILRCLTAPVSIINALLYIVASPKMGVIVGMLISVGCCYFLAVRRGKPLTFMIAAVAFPLLILIPMGLFSILALIFGNIGKDTVIQTVPSTSGKYYAQVIDSDQGALGGDTLVIVFEKSKINAIIFNIEKKPQLVYIGQWGEFWNMRIRWKNDGCLIINSREYEIK